MNSGNIGALHKMHKNTGFAQEAVRLLRTRKRISVGNLGLALVAVSLGLAACSDEPASELQAPAQTAEEKPSHQLEWLRLTDGIAPEQWLASREAGRSLDLQDPAVADMRRVLDMAAVRFRDQPRMVANRAVQLEAMLKEKSIEEKAPRIIVNLSQVPGQSRYVESFGALAQQYYNLRMEGASRSQAIDRLRQQNALRP